MYSYGPPHMAVQKQDDQHEHTFNRYVRIRDVVLKTYLGRWTIGRSGERGSGISVIPARYDDDDIYILVIFNSWNLSCDLRFHGVFFFLKQQSSGSYENEMHFIFLTAWCVLFCKKLQEIQGRCLNSMN